MWSLISGAVRSSSVIEQMVLYLLIIFSIVSWGLILMKIRTLRAARQNNHQFLTDFNASETIGEFTPPKVSGPSPLATIFTSAVDTLENAGHSGVRHVRLAPDKLHEKVMLRMQHTAKDELARLRTGSGFLASVGSSAPFIGLFGTVLGIMATFQKLGEQKSASLQVVGPSISAALVATAAGLAVAIPAVMAYNWILAQVESVQEETDSFIERMDFLTRTQNADGSAADSSTGNGSLGSPASAVRGS